MGTRSVIARHTTFGFEGRYHHWDGYPDGLGVTLVMELEKRGAIELRKILIDNEPTGWSTINGANLDLPPTWIDGGTDEEHGPLSYSARGEEPQELIRSDGSDWGTEWAYIIEEGFDGPDSIRVLERRFGTPDEDEGHGVGMFGYGASDTDSGGYWKEIATVKAGDKEAMLAVGS